MARFHAKLSKSILNIAFARDWKLEPICRPRATSRVIDSK